MVGMEQREAVGPGVVGREACPVQNPQRRRQTRHQQRRGVRTNSTVAFGSYRCV